jgi:hypothetical protein
MKKILLLLISLCSLLQLTSYGQLIPNGGFETWENRFLFLKPSGWISDSDSKSAPLTVIRSSDALAGNWSVKLNSILEEAKHPEDEDEVRFGYAVFGEDPEEEMPVATPWENTVDSIHFSVKYDIAAGDGALVWIQVKSQGSVVFEMIDFLTGHTSGNWINIKLAMDEGNPVNADSVLVGFTSSVPEGFPGGEVFTPKEGSWIIIDEVYFTLGSASEQVTIPIPNGGFENWEDVEAFEPAGWTSYNSSLAAQGIQNVTQSEPEHTFAGNHSARLETKEFYSETREAMLSLGNGLWDEGGIPFTARPVFFSYAYKHVAVDPEAYGWISLQFKKDGMEFDLGGTFIQLPPNPEFKRYVTTDIFWQTEGNPDYLYLQVSSSNELGSLLYVDELDFPTGREIRIVVENPAEEPIVNAEVSITGLDPVFMTPLAPQTTNENGEVVFILPDGQYTYSIVAAGFEPVTEQALSVSGVNQLITETLSPISFTGEGTELNPWLIENAAQLNNLRNFLGDGHTDVYFRLAEDIHLGEAPWNAGFGWLPIGNNMEAFKAHLDGNGKTINGLTIDRPELNHVGLFGYVSDNTIMNLTLSDASVTGQGITGLLAGRSSQTTITGVHASGTVEGDYSVGGLIGYLENSSELSNSSFEGLIVGSFDVGGLTGLSSFSLIEKCHSAASINSSFGSNTGGIAGFNMGFIQECYSTGNVMGNEYVGGLAGVNTSQITNSYSTASVMAPQGKGGGLVGYNDWAGSISDSYSVGKVNGPSNVGGAAGLNDGMEFLNVYWNTETSGQNASASGMGKTIAEMITETEFPVAWFTDKWSIEDGVSYPYLTWQAMALPHNYPPAFPSPINLSAIAGDNEIALAWEVASSGTPTGFRVYRNGNPLITLGNTETSYLDEDVENFTFYTYHVTALYNGDESEPSNMITASPNPGYSVGSGTELDPFHVGTPEELYMVRLYLDAWFLQVADIDLGTAPWNAEFGWLPIGHSGNRFRGHYDGNGYTIRNLTMNRPMMQTGGLFGHMEGANVSNLVLENADISGGAFFGSLAGKAGNSQISNVSAHGILYVTWSSGGLVGLIENSSQILNCSFSGLINGDTNLGGLVGHASFSEIVNSESNAEVISPWGTNVGGLVGHNNYSSITGSFSSGTVQGYSYTGGVVGYNSGTISTSHSHSDVQTIEGYAGGISGYNDLFAGLTTSYATGDVSGESHIGGLIGRNESNNTLYDLYATGDVTGEQHVGGLAGSNGMGSAISRSYSIGQVTGDANTGGLTGLNEGTIEDSYWNTETSGQASSSGGSGKITSEMLKEDTFPGWFTGSEWQIIEDETYPFLSMQPGALPHNYPAGILITQTAPEEGAEGVPVDSGIQVWFNHHVQEGASGFAGITLSSVHGDASISVSIVDNQLLITPNDPLEFETAYSLRIPVGSIARADDISKTLAEEFILSFTSEVDPNKEYVMTISLVPAGAGTIAGDGLVEAAGVYTGSYTAGTLLEFTATANEGYEFEHWLVVDGENEEVIEEDGVPVGNVLSGPMPNFDVELKAKYRRYYDLTVLIVPEGTGTVSAPGMLDGAGTYLEGEQFEITATANPGFVFEHWTYFDGFLEVIIESGGIPVGNVLEITMPPQNVELNAKFKPEEPKTIAITITDDDEDRIYFAGDVLSLTAAIGGFDVPDGLVPSVHGGIFDKDMNFIEEMIFENLNASMVIGPPGFNSFTVTGTLMESTNTGVIGLRIGIGDYYFEPIPLIDDALYNPISGSSLGMCITGVRIPAGDILASPGLGEFENLYNTEKDIIFSRSGHGNIRFGPGLNIIDNREELQSLQTNLRLVSDPGTETHYAEINPAALSFLAGKGAQVSIPDFGQANFSVRKTPFGVAADYDSPEDPVANSTASLTGSDLVFNVNGFSRYSILSVYVLNLVASPETGGTVNNYSDPGPYAAGKVVLLDVSAAEGFEFLNWTENGSEVSTEYAMAYIMPARDVTLTANFVRILALDGLTASNKVYDGTVDANISDYGTLVGLLDAEHDVNLVTSSAFALFSYTDVGEDIEVFVTQLSLAGADADKYSIHDQTTTASILKRPLTITAEDKSKVSGEADPEFTVSYEGFVLAEDKFNLDGSLTFSFNPANTDAPGVYEIIPGGFTSLNYEINFVKGTFAIYVRLSLEVSPDGAGTVTGGGDTFLPGDKADISATANQGYQFVEWTDGAGNVVTLTEGQYTMPANNVVLTANFEAIHEVTFTVLGQAQAPLQGANIAISRDGTSIGSLTTGADGKASIELPNGNYTFRVTATDYVDFDGTFAVASATLGVNVNLSHVGISDLLPGTGKMKVFPNPSNGIIQLEYERPGETSLKLEVLSISGSVLHVKEFQGSGLYRETIDLQHLSKGVYLLRIANSKDNRVVRLILK